MAQSLYKIQLSKLDEENDKFNEVIKHLDQSLNKVLKRQEADYLKGYSIYVREKERELRGLVQRLNERNNSSSLKDEMIYGLKQQVSQLYKDASKQQDERKAL